VESDVRASVSLARRLPGTSWATRTVASWGWSSARCTGTEPDLPDARAVRRKGFFFAHKRHLVPADAIEEIGETSGVVGLSVERDTLGSFSSSDVKE